MAKKKTAKKASKKSSSRSSSGKFSFLDEVLASILDSAEVTRKGEVKLKRSDVKLALEAAFEKGAVAAAGGERVKVPFLGTLAFREVKARKAGMQMNPFTKQPAMVAARPASRKPRFSFSRLSKDVFSAKKNW
ncbi:MAG: HU family DNA-binding protein [Leptospirales bacterium]|nr:HU family DNA-binding protein [Leptospirales bacterium]